MLKPLYEEMKEILTSYASEMGTLDLEESYVHLVGAGYDVTRDSTLGLLKSLCADEILTHLGSHDTHGAPVFKYNF
jgi:hypothetical protein